MKSQIEQFYKDDKSFRQYFFQVIETDDIGQISSVKSELAVLRRQRSRLEAKLALIRRNIDVNNTEFMSDFIELQRFFPFIEMHKIQEIETFHRKLQSILKVEFQAEQRQTEMLLQEIIASIGKNEIIIEETGIPEKISKRTLDRYSEIKTNLQTLEAENASYNEAQNLKINVKTITLQLTAQQAIQLRELETNINVKMDGYNTVIYDGLKKSPILSLKENGKSYVFETPDDTGTGTSYKGLVVFDLSILALTSLPVLIHDSVILKQIADAPLEKILELYQQSGKQVFIALDKGGSYTRRTEEILDQTAVLRLSDNGNELFGRSWNVKTSV